MISDHQLDVWQEKEMVPIPSGLWVPTQAAADFLSGIRRPTCVDLFAGAGGASLGVIAAGFRVVAAVDNDASAALTYLANLGSYPLQMHFVSDEDESRFEKLLIREMKSAGAFRSGVHRPADRPGVGHFWLGDIRRIHGQEILDAVGMGIGELDCVIGGPPCQGFSFAGKRQITDPRNALVLDFARLVCEMKPKTMIMENVPGILNMVTPDGFPVMDELARVLEDGGFGTRDAFLKSVRMQSGRVGLLRGKKRPKCNRKVAAGEMA